MSSERENFAGALLETVLDSAGEHAGGIGLAAFFYYGSLLEYLQQVGFLGFDWWALGKFLGLATALFLVMLVILYYIVEKVVGPVITRLVRRISNSKKREKWEGGLGFFAALLVIGIFVLSCLWCWSKIYTQGPQAAEAKRQGQIAEPPPASASLQPPGRSKDTEVVSLGSFSDGEYQLELWRDDSSNGRVLGRIGVYPQDVSKNPFIGQLSALSGNGFAGPLRFSSRLSSGPVSFEGVVKNGAIEGLLRSEAGPHQTVFRRLGVQYDKNYATRRAWSKEMAELLACCGPSARPGK